MYNYHKTLFELLPVHAAYIKNLPPAARGLSSTKLLKLYLWPTIISFLMPKLRRFKNFLERVISFISLNLGENRIYGTYLTFWTAINVRSKTRQTFYLLRFACHFICKVSDNTSYLKNILLTYSLFTIYTMNTNIAASPN